MNIDKLKKRLCPKDGCTGYLFKTINSKREEIMRCNDCHNFIHYDDFECLITGNDIDDNSQDPDYNLSQLNNL